MKIGIIGYGEIGKGLHKIYSEFPHYKVCITDPKLNLYDNIDNCSILNICIPYSENFTKTVNDYIDITKPNLTVVHSTVAPTTTSKLNGRVCHSPVRGLHPNIDIGLKTFVKWIGSEDINISLEYQTHLKELGIASFICENSKTSEYAKLLDTTYYGLCISFHNDVFNLCEREGIVFEEVMTKYNQTYNEGYSKLNKLNVIRPILTTSKKIGGHCIIPNVHILKEYFKSELLQNILKYE